MVGHLWPLITCWVVVYLTKKQKQVIQQAIQEHGKAWVGETIQDIVSCNYLYSGCIVCLIGSANNGTGYSCGDLKHRYPIPALMIMEGIARYSDVVYKLVEVLENGQTT